MPIPTPARGRTFGALPLIHVGAVAVFLWSVGQFYHPETGFTSLIRFGERFEPRTLAAIRPVPRHIERKSVGYDGQFYAQMATDPLLRDPAIDRALDDAPLRARRILFAWTAYVAGLGRPAWILQAYALQNVACWLLLSLLLLRWFPVVDARTTALWLASLFTGGLMWSVRSALLDGPSLLMLALGIALLERGWRWTSAVIFGIAGLGRETNILAAAAQSDPRSLSWRSLVRQAAQLLIIVLPLAVWFDYIYSIYRSLIYTSGGTLSAPFSAFMWKWNVTLADIVARGLTGGAKFNLLALVAISVQVAFIVLRPAWKEAWWRLGLAYAALMPFLGRPLWEGEPGTVVRALLPLAVAFNVMLRRCEDPRWFWCLFVGGNLTVIHGLAMLGVPLVSWWQ